MYGSKQETEVKEWRGYRGWRVSGDSKEDEEYQDLTRNMVGSYIKRRGAGRNEEKGPQEQDR